MPPRTNNFRGRLFSLTLISSCSWIFGCGSLPIVVTPLVPHRGAPADVTRLRVIGNSITWHSPEADLDWSGDWGMAASSMDRDFAHGVATSLSLPLTRFNVADLERTPGTAGPTIVAASAGVDAQTAVVVELGDNVAKDAASIAAFQPAFHSLLDALGARKSLVCTSTFWVSSPVDAVLRQECESHGGRFVSIGDLYTDPKNPDAATNTFSNAGVAAHPHDWSMANIAIRVSAALSGT